MVATHTERVACSQICPGCHVLPQKDGLNNHAVICDHVTGDPYRYVGSIPSLEDSRDPDLGLIVDLACKVPEKKMFKV